MQDSPCFCVKKLSGHRSNLVVTSKPTKCPAMSICVLFSQPIHQIVLPNKCYTPILNNMHMFLFF